MPRCLRSLREEQNPTGDLAPATAMGRRAGNNPTGRTGRGILVADKDRGGFSALSLYRFRAVVKKQRRDNAKGQRLELRSRMNMNKMGKKANNLMTGVCTAMMPR